MASVRLPRHSPRCSEWVHRQTHQLARPRLWLSMMGLMVVVVVKSVEKSPKVWKICIRPAVRKNLASDPPSVHGYKELELSSGLLGLGALSIPLSDRLSTKADRAVDVHWLQSSLTRVSIGGINRSIICRYSWITSLLNIIHVTFRILRILHPNIVYFSPALCLVVVVVLHHHQQKCIYYKWCTLTAYVITTKSSSTPSPTSFFSFSFLIRPTRSPTIFVPPTTRPPRINRWLSSCKYWLRSLIARSLNLIIIAVSPTECRPHPSQILLWTTERHHVQQPKSYWGNYHNSHCVGESIPTAIGEGEEPESMADGSRTSMAVSSSLFITLSKV